MGDQEAAPELATTMGLGTRVGEVPIKMVALLPEQLETDSKADFDFDETLEQNS